MDLIKKEQKGAAVLSVEGKRKPKLSTERLRKIIKANDRNDWFNMIALLILLLIVIAGVAYYFFFA